MSGVVSCLDKVLTDTDPGNLVYTLLNSILLFCVLGQQTTICISDQLGQQRGKWLIILGLIVIIGRNKSIKKK